MKSKHYRASVLDYGHAVVFAHETGGLTTSSDEKFIARHGGARERKFIVARFRVSCYDNGDVSEVERQ